MLICERGPQMEVESSRSYLDDIYSSDTQKCLAALVHLKNTIIGSNRQKGHVIDQGVVPRLLQMLADVKLPNSIRCETVIVLTSLAKGTDQQVEKLLKENIVSILFNAIDPNDTDNKLTEHILKCLCSIFTHSSVSIDLIFNDTTQIALFLRLLMKSVSNQISITTIFSMAANNQKHQKTLWNEGAVFSLSPLLGSPHQAVIMPTLTCISNMCYENSNISKSFVHASWGGKSVPDWLVCLMARHKPIDMQLLAAKCFTLLHRTNAVPADDPRILFKTLPVLIYLCQDYYTWQVRVSAAESLAFLTEVSIELQRTAAMSNHLIKILSTFINYNGDEMVPPEQANDVRKELTQAAFRVYASLASNDEDIRKKVIESENLIHYIVTHLEDPNTKLKLSAIRCLHSLSRSVHQLRTTFHDHAVWKSLMRLLENAPDDVIAVTSSTLCNLLLEFSPSKEPIVESGAINLLCELTKRPDSALRLNGIWALMNMAFQAEQKIKSLILNSLGIEQIFKLLTDSETTVIMKTLGLLRNLLSTKPHIDNIMHLYGPEIMRAVMMILNDSGQSNEVKEQALCILANIADGDTAKDYLMKNEDVLKKLQDYMVDKNVKVQVAAIFCISNLVWKEETGSMERQATLKDLGVLKLLQQLVVTTNTMLFDKVKTAMTQFSDV